MKWKYLGGRDIFVDLVLMVSGQLNETGFIKLGKGTKRDILKVTFVAWTVCKPQFWAYFLFLWWFSDLNVMTEDPKGTSVRMESSRNQQNITSEFAAKVRIRQVVILWLISIFYMLPFKF